MFQLSRDEAEAMVSQNVIPNKSVLGGASPMAFSEQGVAMLSSVLNSKKAVEVNIAIIRTFVHIRRMLEDNRELANKISRLERKYDEKFQIIFNAIRGLIKKNDNPRNQIGYKRGKEKESKEK